jgi:hypothetical protein
MTYDSTGPGGRGKGRYPNQFFDLSQQYMPPTIKELLKWCRFYYYNSPLIGAAMKKVSRYPITDIIIDDDSQSKQIWDHVLTRVLKMKDRLMEINLDYHVFGNSFTSLHFPFTRWLICRSCGNRKPIRQWTYSFRAEHSHFHAKCNACNNEGPLTVKDVYSKDLKKIRLIRWSPINMTIKYNEYTGRYIYYYTVPRRDRDAVLRGDKDVLEDMPLIVLEAIRKNRPIKFSDGKIKHSRYPTLAEEDQGWGKPVLLHVMKDMFYMTTLRRAQEAIALEHIVPFDMVYPLPNSQQDPYIHTDLGNWRTEITDAIQKQRMDPNYKAVLPIPVGYGRLGGDGKSLLLTPELNYLTQTIIGGLGLPSDMVLGGMQWSGSSITLRMLENDFIQNRSQMLELLEWVKDEIRIYMQLPNVKGLRFADFRMADDIQKNQQLIGLNAQNKISDQTLLTELGYDYEVEVKKLMAEAKTKAKLQDIMTIAGARSQGEAQIIAFGYQQKLDELQQSAMAHAQAQMPGEAPPMVQQMPQGALPAGQEGGEGGQADPQSQSAAVDHWAQRLMQVTEGERAQLLAQMSAKMPELAGPIKSRLSELTIGQSAGSGKGITPPPTDDGGVDMRPAPQQRPPRRNA